MKSPAAALGTLLTLTACAHGPTTTTMSSVNASAPSGPAATAAPAARSSQGSSVREPSPAAASSDRRPHSAPYRAAQRAVHRPLARTTPKVGAAPAPVMPQILGASVSPTVVGSGTTVSATVRTTPGVMSVVAYAGGASMAVPRVGPGLFEGSTTLPPLPPFAHGSYAVTFVARDARGASTQSAVGVTVR
ncbi:MAG TPA: hypothetical protein VK669_03410 [Candidatus Limnocylindrales bacterium]|nr:hypothetical protein [Candidatus Limnocylindrales bacterium]